MNHLKIRLPQKHYILFFEMFFCSKNILNNRIFKNPYPKKINIKKKETDNLILYLYDKILKE